MFVASNPGGIQIGLLAPIIKRFGLNQGVVKSPVVSRNFVSTGSEEKS
jgi:hypothetical protein